MCSAELQEPFTYAPPRARSQERLCSGGRSRGRPRWSRGLSGGSSEQGPQGFVSTWGLCHFVAYVTFGKSPRLGAPPCAPLWRGHLPAWHRGAWETAGAKRGGASRFPWPLWEKGLWRVEGGGLWCGAPRHGSRCPLALACGGGGQSLPHCVVACGVERVTRASLETPDWCWGTQRSLRVGSVVTP